MKKNLNYLPLFFTVIVFSFMSCSDEDSGPAEPKKVLNFLVDGEMVDYADDQAVFNFISASITDQKSLSIVGQSDSETFNLSVGSIFSEDPITERSYTIGTAQDNLKSNLTYVNYNDLISTDGGAIYTYNDEFGCDVLSSTAVGQITITEIDEVNKVVSGTFNGSLFRWTDVQTAEREVIEITDGNFELPYTERTSDIDPDADFVSARVRGYRFRSSRLVGGGPYRSDSSGFDKIVFEGEEYNFGIIKIAIPSNVTTGNSYSYRYDTDPGSNYVGVSFWNWINIPENLITFNPDQSNDSKITITRHDTNLNVIEGTFYIENSAVEGETITEGEFKITYNDLVDND